MKRRGFFAGMLGTVALAVTGGKWGKAASHSSHEIAAYVQHIDHDGFVCWKKTRGLVSANVINEEAREEIERRGLNHNATINIRWGPDGTETIFIEPHVMSSVVKAIAARRGER